MTGYEAEELAALAANWRQAEESRDGAASQAFEDELHARVPLERMRELEAPDPGTGEASAAETQRLRGALERMWSNASARLD